MFLLLSVFFSRISSFPYHFPSELTWNPAQNAPATPPPGVSFVSTPFRSFVCEAFLPSVHHLHFEGYPPGNRMGFTTLHPGRSLSEPPQTVWLIHHPRASVPKRAGPGAAGGTRKPGHRLMQLLAGPNKERRGARNPSRRSLPGAAPRWKCRSSKHPFVSRRGLNPDSHSSTSAWFQALWA